MPPSAFLDRGDPPSKRALEAVLVKASGLWDRLLEELSSRFAPVTGTWSYSGRSHGWILRVRQRRRTVLYLVPCPAYFVASFALGEKACRAASAGKLPDRVLEAIANAPSHAEGRAVRLEVRSTKDLAIVEELASIKMAN